MPERGSRNSTDSLFRPDSATERLRSSAPIRNASVMREQQWDQGNEPKHREYAQHGEHHAEGVLPEDRAECLRRAIADGGGLFGPNPGLALRLVGRHQRFRPGDVSIVSDPDTTMRDAPATRTRLVELDGIGVEHVAHVVGLI